MGKSRLLVVEDDIDIGNMLKIYFSGMEFEVDVAVRGSDALEKTKQSLPHLIVLDIMLPDIDGYEVCRNLRTNMRTSHIPVIFLTQKDERSDKLQGLELGADDYITKPFDIEELRDRLKVHARCELIVSTKMDVLKEAQLILTVTSAIHDVVRPEHLQPGSVVCDVARPRDVSAMVAAVRDDILVIDGGMVDVPGPVDFHFNFGFPAGKAYACMAETIALALEGRFEDYTLGKHLTRARVEEIDMIAKKHGFRLSGFRSFEKEVTTQQIEAVRRNAKNARLTRAVHT